jgi:hypothetical protein
MASRELQKTGQEIVDDFNARIRLVLNALQGAKNVAEFTVGEWPKRVDDAIEAAKAIDNTGPDVCLHCSLGQTLAVWAAYHMDEDLKKIEQQGWNPREPGQLPEAMIRATIAIAGLGQLAGEVAREADDTLRGSGLIISRLITHLLRSFAIGAGVDLQMDPVEVIQPHPGSPLKH